MSHLKRANDQLAHCESTFMVWSRCSRLLNILERHVYLMTPLAVLCSLRGLGLRDSTTRIGMSYECAIAPCFQSIISSLVFAWVLYTDLKASLLRPGRCCRTAIIDIHISIDDQQEICRDLSALNLSRSRPLSTLSTLAKQIPVLMTSFSRASWPPRSPRLAGD
jgi:hypothetical protein